MQQAALLVHFVGLTFRNN